MLRQGRKKERREIGWKGTEMGMGMEIEGCLEDADDCELRCVVEISGLVLFAHLELLRILLKRRDDGYISR